MIDTQRPENLNDSQWNAVIHPAKYLLIVAGPGTGKTHTLTHRIDRVANKLQNGQQILAITFTNKAATEMRERLEKQIDIDKRITIGTFHYFCLLVLREHIHSASDIPADFRVASPEEIEPLSKELWPDKKVRERKLLLEKISRWKSIEFNQEMPEEVCTYNKKLRESGLIDFDDLLLETLLLLKHNEDIRSGLQNKFRHVFVDEYQDINAVQHALLKALVGEEGSLTAIGDPNQAIYGFRGSDVRFFESFAADFSEAETLSLSDNYRSAQNLLSASGQIMAKSSGLHVPELTARIYSKGRLTVHSAATDKAEAEYVVHQIEKMVGGTSMFSQDSGRVSEGEEDERSFGDFVVLYRLNSQRLALQEAFDRSGMPYQVSGYKPSGEAEDLVNDFYFSKSNEIYGRAEKVSLMTIHASKGLEFPVVFVVGCEQNILPLDLGSMTAEVEEERRLFYVGMTRAKERLFLVRAKRRRLYGKTYQNDPSIFLADIEEELKEYEKLTAKARPAKKVDDQMTLF